MKNMLKIFSLTAFILAIPSLIVVDWFYKGYGILMMFALITIGLVFDQIIRMKYPRYRVTSLQNYHMNKLLNLFALTLFVQAPMALIFGNMYMYRLGFWLMATMICSGIVLNQIARIRFGYQIEIGEKEKCQS